MSLEESYGVLDLKTEHLLEKGTVLYKKSSSGRDIFYVLYPLSEKEYVSVEELTTLVRENKALKSEEFLERFDRTCTKFFKFIFFLLVNNNS